MRARFVFMAVYRGWEMLFGPWHSRKAAQLAADRFSRRMVRGGRNKPITYVMELHPGPSAPATAQYIIDTVPEEMTS